MAQKYTSANTSINSRRLPRLFSLARDRFRPGTLNLDVGGGKFDNVTDFLAGLDVINLVYDPYNRPQEHNEAVLAMIGHAGADTVTCANVLNVIDDDGALDALLADCARWTGQDGIALFYVYEGDRSGTGRPTKADCYQRNEPLSAYVPRIARHFGSVTVTAGLVVARH